MTLMLAIADDPGDRFVDFQLDFLREMRKENREYFPNRRMGEDTTLKSRPSDALAEIRYD
jgi:hypothetical protein